MKYLNKLTAIVLTAVLSFSLTGCGEPEVAGEYLTYRWIDSDLFENIEEMSKADLKDDFAAAVNYKWASVQEKDFNYRIGAIGDVSKKVDENKRALLDDESVQNKNIELLRTAEGLFCDWEYRDSLGVEPLKKYLNCIDEIKTTDDVSAYMLDNDKNPFGAALVEIVYWANDSLDDRMSLIVEKPKLSMEKKDYYITMDDDGIKAKEKVETQVLYLLQRCGYSKKEAKKILKRCFRFESKLVHLDFTDYANITFTFSKSEVLEKAGKYPLEDMLNHYSMGDCDYFAIEPDYIDRLESLYTQKNVEDIKAYFKVRLALESIPYLDSESFDVFKDSMLDRSNPFSERIDHDTDYNFFYSISQSPLSAAMDQEYLNYYYNEDTYNEINEYINLIRDKYKILINSNEKLSEESKKAVSDKLDNMTIHIMKPSNTADFSGVELKSADEGGTYLDAMCVLSKLKYEHVGEMVNKIIPRSYWDISNKDVSTTLTNAFYSQDHNTIFIDIGILEDPFYSPDASFEENLAAIGTVIGHEISHAFDSSGIYKDRDGKYNNVVTSEELQNWTEMSTRIITHLSTFEPFEGSGKYDASSTITGEVIADIEGVRVCLLLAEDYDSFDYDLFFRSYAKHWSRLDTKSNEIDAIKTDNHPLPYLRTNYTLMQFEKFDETYEIEPGDGMYLDPDYRIVIW